MQQGQVRLARQLAARQLCTHLLAAQAQLGQGAADEGQGVLVAIHHVQLLLQLHQVRVLVVPAQAAQARQLGGAQAGAGAGRVALHQRLASRVPPQRLVANIPAQLQHALNLLHGQPLLPWRVRVSAPRQRCASQEPGNRTCCSLSASSALGLWACAWLPKTRRRRGGRAAQPHGRVPGVCWTRFRRGTALWRKSPA